MSCPQIWNIEQEKVGGRPATLNEKRGDTRRSRARDKKKQKKTCIFWLEEQHENFVAAVTNASGHQCKVKMSGSEKKVNENTYVIFYKKRVTKKFLEFSRCSLAKQWHSNVQKKCAARAKLLFR